MKTIIVAVDFSDKTHLLLGEAKKIAECFNSDVYLIHVAAPEPDFIGYKTGPDEERDSRSSKLHLEKKELERYARNLKKSGINTTSLLIQGETSKLLIQESTRLHANMLIMGTHSKSLASSVILGNISKEIVKNADCPILLVP
jgi:nucleotide-binding universal stress UspA family protein